MTPLEKIESSGLYGGKPFVAIHRISDFSIVEIPLYDSEKTKFRPYVNGEPITGGFLTLDSAIFTALCYKYSQGTGSMYWAAKLIDMELK
jgi:hypothetical protein